MLLAQCCADDQIKKDEMGVACSTFVVGGDERCIQGLGGETWKKETTWKISLKWGDNIKVSFINTGC